jgi:hypothetical protein
MGWLSDLFGGGNDSSKTSGKSTTTVPSWLENPTKDLINTGSQLIKNDYQQYPNQRIAGFTPDQQKAFQMQRNQVGDWQPLTGQAGNVLSGIAGLNSQYNPTMISAGQGTNQMFDNAQAQQYMNPYTNNVIDRGMNRLNQMQAEGQMNVSNAAAKTGGFGGSRHAVAQSLYDRDFNNQKGDFMANQLQNAYTNAQGQFNTDRASNNQMQQFNINNQLGADKANQDALLQGAQENRLGREQQMSAAGGLANLAYLNQGLGAQDIQGMQGIGGLQQALNQQNMDLGYQDFQNQANWPYKQLEFMSNLIRGVPFSSTTTSTGNAQTPQGGGLLQGLLGTGAGIAGLGNSFGWW